MKSYLEEMFLIINDGINEFNTYIDKKFQLDAINVNGTESLVKVTHGDWNGFQFPNGTSRGVYFLFGESLDNELTKGLYIGKATFGSSIGKRMYAHFYGKRKQKYFMINGKNGEPFRIEYIYSIPMEEKAKYILSASLEEYLIYYTKDKIMLINGVGNT